MISQAEVFELRKRMIIALMDGELQVQEKIMRRIIAGTNEKTALIWTKRIRENIKR